MIGFVQAEMLARVICFIPVQSAGSLLSPTKPCQYLATLSIQSTQAQAATSEQSSFQVLGLCCSLPMRHSGLIARGRQIAVVLGSILFAALGQSRLKLCRARRRESLEKRNAGEHTPAAWWTVQASTMADGLISKCTKGNHAPDACITVSYQNCSIGTRRSRPM